MPKLSLVQRLSKALNRAAHSEKIIERKSILLREIRPNEYQKIVLQDLKKLLRHF